MKKIILMLIALTSTFFVGADELYKSNNAYYITNIFEDAIVRLSDGRICAVIDRDLDVGNGDLFDIVFDGGNSFRSWKEGDQVVLSRNDSSSLPYANIIGRVGLYNITQDKYEDVYILPLSGESKVKEVGFEDDDYRILLEDDSKIILIDGLELFETGELESLIARMNVSANDVIVYAVFTLPPMSGKGDIVKYHLYLNADSNQIIDYKAVR